jgi:hypothetical protein
MNSDAPHRLRVIVFFSPDWNFVDGMFPHLRRVLSKLGGKDFRAFHNGIEVRIRGDADDGYDSVKNVLLEAASTPYFPGFKMGTAEGVSSGSADDARVAASAWKNGHDAPPIARPRAGEKGGSLRIRFARFVRAFGAMWRWVS